MEAAVAAAELFYRAHRIRKALVQHGFLNRTLALACCLGASLVGTGLQVDLVGKEGMLLTWA